MFKRLSLIHILIFCVIVIVAGFIYVMQLPATNTKFDKSAASLDTSSFTAYAKGKVTEVVFEQVDEIPNGKSISQQLKVVITDAPKSGQEVVIDHTAILDKAGSVQYKAGDKVVLGQLPNEIYDEFVIIDKYRLPGVYIVVTVFLILAIVVGRKRGLTSLVGLGITGCILMLFIAPQILSGKDPFLVALVGAGAIILVSMFISHGFNRRIQISAVSTILTLIITAVMAYVFVYISKLFGFGQSDAFLLETGFLGSINLQGVLLAGIIISVLGVLDDVTTAQTAAIEELHKTDSTLSLKSLYQKGLSIGREHIASLINTLILVYAGAALPLFLLLTLQKSQPLWVLLNSEFIAEELVRSLVGSTTLILAVPISTLLAAYIYSSNRNKEN
jgi:uncharacterized membrane protein